MLDDIYKDIEKKTPREIADIVGEVKKNNYLAHSIRELEMAIYRRLSKNYRIFAHYKKTGSKISSANFFDNGCQINLPNESDTMEDRDVRLVLAHELGHIVLNISNLKNPELIDKKASDEEEVSAWEFSYYLIKKKSDEYKKDSNNTTKRFVFSDTELRAAILSTVNERANIEVYNAVNTVLNPLPK